MWIDDEEVGVIRLARGVYNIEANATGGLYIGGLPDNVTLADMAATSKPFVGLIKQLALNRQLIVLEHKHFFDSNLI